MPEFHVYDTKTTRYEGQSLQFKTRAVYLPCMLTSMVMLHAGKEVNRADRTDVCTFHLRPTILYRIAVEIQWFL